MEEPAFLLAAQWIIGGVQVENDLRRRAPVRLQEEIDQHVSIAAGSWLTL